MQPVASNPRGRSPWNECRRESAGRTESRSAEGLGSPASWEPGYSPAETEASSEAVWGVESHKEEEEGKGVGRKEEKEWE